MATKVWFGGAPKSAQITYIDISGTWGAGERITLTIGTSELEMVVGDTSVDGIVNALTAMINGTAAVSTEIRSSTGPVNGEWAELVAVANTTSDRVEVTGRSDGTPFTLTASDNSGTGTAATSTPADPERASGNDWDNALNWSGSAKPVATDDVVFDHRAVAPLLYGLDQNALALTSLTVTEGFRHSIGLPGVNEHRSDLPYDEYRERYLKVRATTLTIRGGSGRIQIDTGSAAATTALVNRPAQSLPDGTPSVQLTGNHASNNYIIERGDVGLAYQKGQTTQAANIRIGQQGAGVGDVIVKCGSDLTIGTKIFMTAGRLETNGNVPTIDMISGEWVHYSGTVTTCNNHGGALKYLSDGTMTTYNGYGGSDIDFSENSRARTVTNMTLTKGSGYADPLGTVTHTNGKDLYGCAPDELTRFLIPKHKTITLSTI